MFVGPQGVRLEHPLQQPPWG